MDNQDIKSSCLKHTEKSWGLSFKLPPCPVCMCVYAMCMCVCRPLGTGRSQLPAAQVQSKETERIAFEV